MEEETITVKRLKTESELQIDSRKEKTESTASTEFKSLLESSFEIVSFPHSETESFYSETHQDIPLCVKEEKNTIDNEEEEKNASLEDNLNIEIKEGENELQFEDDLLCDPSTVAEQTSSNAESDTKFASSYNREDIHELLFRWLKDPGSDEEQTAFSDDDEDEEEDDDDDYFLKQKQSSSSEQDVSFSEEEENEEIRSKYLKNFKGSLMGRDKKTKWNKNKFKENMKLKEINTSNILPCVLGTGKFVSTPVNSWYCFITDNILELIVHYTNINLSEVRKNYKRERDTRDTTKNEIKAFIGLLYLAGILSNSRRNINHLWATDGTGVEIFAAVMSFDRFRILMQGLRFDDRETRKFREIADKIAPIRSLFDMFVDNCKYSYSPSHFATVDDKLVPFRGKCNFGQFRSKKRAKYGIKMFALVDAHTLYTSNLEIDAGIQPEGPYEVSNIPEDIVERLCQPISGSGRNVTVNNWCCSYELAQRLLRYHKLTLVGSLHRMKPEIPSQFTNVKNRKENSSMFGFQENCTLLSHVSKRGKNLLLISTLFGDEMNATEPEMLTCYDWTRSSVDTMNRICTKYSCGRKSTQWSTAVFYNLLDIACINAYVVYHTNSNPRLPRKEFLKKLGLDLVKDRINECAGTTKLDRITKEKMSKLIGSYSKKKKPERGKRGRCYMCKGKNRRTQYYCCKCYRFLCLEHVNPLCKDCATSCFGDEPE